VSRSSSRPKYTALPDVWTLTFEPCESKDFNDVPVQLRVRHLLKFALRSVGLRCVDLGGRTESVDALLDLEKRLASTEDEQ